MLSYCANKIHILKVCKIQIENDILYAKGAWINKMNQKNIRLALGLALFLVIALTLLVLTYTGRLVVEQVVKDINAGVISALLTALITLLLLSLQSDKDEIATKKSVIYEEKIRTFKSFINVLGSAIEDGALSTKELRTIVWNYSLVRMVIENSNNQKNLDSIMQEIDSSIITNDENKIPNYERLSLLFNTICDIFKTELYQGVSGSYHSPAFENFRRITLDGSTLSFDYVVKSIDEVIEFLGNNRKFRKTIDGVLYTYEINNPLLELFLACFTYVDQRIFAQLGSSVQRDFVVKYKDIGGDKFITAANVAYKSSLSESIVRVGLSGQNMVLITFENKDGKQIILSRLNLEHTSKVDQHINFEKLVEKLKPAK